MSEPKTWQEVQAAKPDPHKAAVKAWHASSCSDDLGRMIDAIDAFEEAAAIYRQCDEPGCQRDGSCGWPVRGGGYRRTCFEHMRPDEPDPAHPA